MSSRRSSPVAALTTRMCDACPMTRDQLAHVLRAVSELTGDPDVLVIGSQSILGSYSENELPPVATGSMEVDTASELDRGYESAKELTGPMAVRQSVFI